MVGGCLLKLRRDADAVVALSEAMATLVAAVGDAHARTTYAREMLAVALARCGRPDEAWAALEACQPSALFAFDAARHGMRRAQVLYMQGRGAEGLRALEAMLAACPQLTPDIQAQQRLLEGEGLALAGRHVEAVTAFEAAESLVANRWVPHSVVLAEIRRRLADARAAAALSPVLRTGQP
jgi:hypothetical protein